MRKIVSCGATALVLAVTPLSPAAAAPGGTVPTAVTVLDQSTCPGGSLGPAGVSAAKGADGRTHGFASYHGGTSCDHRITYFAGSGTSWQSVPTALRGQVVDVAADATGTYLLYIDRPDGDRVLTVARRAADGTFTDRTVLAELGSNRGGGQDGRGSIVARDGRWFAVWPRFAGTIGKFTLEQAGTLFDDGARVRPVRVEVPTTPASTDTFPALALGPDGQPRLFWQREVSWNEEDLLLSVGDSGAWNPAQRVAASVWTSDLHPGALDIAVTGRRTFLSWSVYTGEFDRVVVAESAGGPWRTSTPPSDPEQFAWGARLQASGSTVFTAFAGGDRKSVARTSFAGHRNGSGTWNVTSAAVGIPHSDDAAFGLAALIYHGRGTTTELIYSAGGLYAITRQR